MIKRILQNRLSYLSVSFVLFLAALPLVSLGTTNDWRLMSTIGMVALSVAAIIPPLQRVLFPPKSK
ncbi:hypothetical protein [Pseudochrobactrum kiredjianiae]|uniref:Uncharacterized protein n=1 Tax=Pseudochrobactrum kiredjianiae TaxID=386305 RepID=A0ABW3V1J6_9HYPH|nr:hypothetical protein [Pseudochrobactrum kiredjianiae]MDM7852411.1 hypothetical protein [Pseudochrobactrum kiredjianiae]